MTSEFRNDDDDAIFPMAWGPIVFEELVYLTTLACVARLGVGLWLTKHMIF